MEWVSRADGPDLDALAAQVDAHEPVALATVVAHPDPGRVGRRLVVRAFEEVDPVEVGPVEAAPQGGGLGSARSDAAVTDDARGLLVSGIHGLLEYGPDGQGVLVTVLSPAAMVEHARQGLSQDSRSPARPMAR